MIAPNEIFDRGLLRRRRSRFASSYADCDFLLARVAEDFRARLRSILRDFPITIILEAHHGLVGNAIAPLPNVQKIIYTGTCWKLLRQCPSPQLMCDEELIPFAQGSVDLVISALTLQSVNDLPGAFVQIRKALKPDGAFLAAIFGIQTLWELREAFALAEEEVESGISPRVAPFADIRDYGHLLQRAGFALPVTDKDIITVNYKTPLHLLQELRIICGGNILIERKKNPLRKSTLMRMAEIYQERFGLPGGRIPATFEIISLTGWAPHESQQQPLRPGSARTRLADSLGVDEISAGEKAANRDHGKKT